MRHVDDAHHAEGDGQTNGGEQQHRAERQAVPGILHRGPQRQAALNGGGRARRSACNRRRLVSAQPGQQRQRFLIAARLDGGDGFELFEIGGIGLEQQDRRARLGEGQLGGLVGFLRQRAVDHRQHGLVMGLEHRLCGLDPLGRIGRQQGQAAQCGFNDTPQFVVEAHGSGTVRNAGDRRAGRGVDGLSVGLRDIDFFGVGISHQPAILQRADDGVGQRIAAGREHADGFFGVGILVVGELADRVFERSRHGRKYRREDQQ